MGESGELNEVYALRSTLRKKAGDGNRTHMASLEGWSFTIKLHPQVNDD